MKIYYSIKTESCPTCGNILRKQNDLVKIFFLLLTFPISFFVMIAYNIIYDRILGEPEIPKIVSKHKQCPRCHTIVKLENHYKFEDLSPMQKLNYDFRWWLRLSYLIGGIAVFSFCFLLLSFLDFDSMALIVFIPTILVCSGIVSIIAILYKRKVQALENIR